MSHSKAKREEKNKQTKKKLKKKKTQICFEHEDFFSLARTVEGEKHDTTSTLRGVLFSAALGSKATFSLASGASPGAHARFRGHATSRRWPPPITFTDHPTSHDASGASGASVVAPHVATIVSAAAGFSFAHCSCLLLLHIQTHLTSEHDGLQGEKDDQHKTMPKVLCLVILWFLLVGANNICCVMAPLYSSYDIQNPIFLTHLYPLVKTWQKIK